VTTRRRASLTASATAVATSGTGTRQLRCDVACLEVNRHESQERRDAEAAVDEALEPAVEREGLVSSDTSFAADVLFVAPGSGRSAPALRSRHDFVALRGTSLR
jgi:hypothetical protein